MTIFYHWIIGSSEFQSRSSPKVKLSRHRLIP